ncbi:hypothetical protein IH992_01245 [Candidatus Poribacteria bacterium]|nr:hypothetical protein [Candidatus Poribacteria bacterium]
MLAAFQLSALIIAETENDKVLPTDKVVEENRSIEETLDEQDDSADESEAEHAEQVSETEELEDKPVTETDEVSIEETPDTCVDEAEIAEREQAELVSAIEPSEEVEVSAIEVEKDATTDDAEEPETTSETTELPEESVTEAEKDTEPIAEVEESEGVESPDEPALTAMETVEEAEEIELPVAEEESPTEASETEQDSQPDSEEEAIEILPKLGVIDEVHNFVEAFNQSQISNAESASASSQDSSGGVKKSAIFEHPRAEGDARIEYELTLPQLESNEKLILHFSIGLRDGIDFDYPLTKPDGVQFAIEILGERRFEASRGSDGIPDSAQWAEHTVDLSEFAGQQIQMAFLTNCNGAGNTNYDWALWGNPRVLKSAYVSLPIENRESEPKMMRGIAVGTFDGTESSLQTVEFAYDEPAPVSEIADEMRQRMLSVAKSQVASDAKVEQEETSIESQPSLVELALYTEQPKLELVAVGTTTAIVIAGDDFELQCTVRNDGAVGLATTNEASVSLNRIKLRRGRHTHSFKTLNSGEETTFVWRIRSFSRPSIAQISVLLRYHTSQGEVRQRVEKVIEIRPSMPKLPAQAFPELHTYELHPHVITENKNLRAVFVRGNQGFEYYLLFAAKNGHYRQVAICNSISEVYYRDASGKPQQMRILPTVYSLSGNNRGDSIVILSSEQKDNDGVLWSYEARFSLSDDAKRLRTEYRLVTDGERQLIAFNGPILRAGDGAFASDKSFALFPGLEFLERDESSSSTRDAAPSINNRLVPHPYKITIPLMAIEHKNSLVGLIWNPLEAWDGEHNMLSAVFASPNWHEKQKNHLMGVFLPTPPDWIEENCFVTQADNSRCTPYILASNCPITIKSQIIVDGNASILDAIFHWTDAYGMPEPLAPPRSSEEELLLSRHALMHTVWDKETGKSRHCVDGAPANAPGFATLLWYDYLATQDADVKQRVLDIAESTIRESGPGGLISPALCHILKWEFPFYFGHVEAGLDRLKEITQGLIDAQEDDGSWRFYPATDRTKTLGQEGDAVLGTCAHSALMLLKHARVTGNEASLEAGLKALKFMDDFNIPRGAQAWECPLYEPDILAAAHAVSAYVDAYEITGNNRYLRRAEYWAATALPFLYHWNLPDRPGMRFASIPVFGTTFYTHSWFGVPVQWCGLVFAYYLQHLARHSNRHPWVKIAEGIMISAMYQQWTEGELKGTYPDGFYGFCTDGRGPHLNPEDIMVNLYALRGVDADISTAIIRNTHGRIHLSTGAQIESATHDDSGNLSFKLRYIQHETSYSTISGYGSKPSGLKVEAEEIPVVEELEKAEVGWLYREEKDIIFIKCRHSTEEMDFEISPFHETESPEEIPSVEVVDEEVT